MSSNIIEIESKEQFKECLKTQKLIIIDFWAEWCWPCRMLMPILHKIAEENNEIQLLTVNSEVCPDIAVEYDVNAIPAIFFVKNWEIEDNFVWVYPEDEILKRISNLSQN